MQTAATQLPLTIERMAVSEWIRLRAIRLSALAAEPHAFGTARHHDLRWSREQWRETLSRNVWLRASTRAGAIHGVVAYFPTDTQPDGAPQLGSMWVDPAARGQGIARRLCDAVADAARADCAQMLGLWVVDGNQGAADAYSRLGFRASGDTKPAPRPPHPVMHRMLLPLTNHTTDRQT
jgi:GNAT superfamily N-acetyltransferase